MEKDKHGFTVRRGNDMPLGISLQNRYFQFVVSMPGHSSCNLVLYKKGEKEPAGVIPMEASVLGVFSVAVQIPTKQGHTGYEYLYQTDKGLVCDPYASKINGRDHFGEEPEYIRAEVFVPKERKSLHQHHALSDLVLYKMHIRGFTKGNASGVRKKGTYAGLAEKIPYLKELGINAVLLLPVTEFDELETEHKKLAGAILGEPIRTYRGQEKKASAKSTKKEEKQSVKVNYWGYTDSAFYFAPKSSYAYRSDRVCEEFSTMVNQFHEAGIDVYLEMMFDGSCSQSFMLDCLRYWVRVYGIDGFHISDSLFPTALAAGDAYLQNTVFMTAQVLNWMREKHPGRFLEYRDNFCMEMRRFIKGDEAMVPAVMHYMKHRYLGTGRIHYMSDHNGFTLHDLYSYDVRHNEANGEHGKDGAECNFSWNCGEEGATKKLKTLALRQKMIKNALAVNFLAQGTPLLLAGDEFGRTKQGNNNAYCQDNEISWLNWNYARKNKDLLDFVKMLIALRKEHSVFTTERELKESDLISCGWPEVSVHGETPWQIDTSSYNRLAAFLYCGAYVRQKDGSCDDSFYLMFNMHWIPHEFKLPQLNGMCWQMVFDTAAGKKIKREEKITGACLKLEARSIVLLQSIKKDRAEKKQS